MKKRLYVASPTVNVETGAMTQDKAMVVEGDDTVPWHKMPDGTMMPGVSMMKPMHMMPDGDWMQGLSIKAMKKMNKHVKEIPSPVVDVETTSQSQTAKAIRASMLKGNKNTILVHEDAVPWHMTPDGSMMPGTMKHPMHMMPNGKWMKGASHKEAMAQMKNQFAVAEPVEGVELGLLKQDKAMVVEGEDTVPWHKMPDGTMMPGLSTKKPIHMMPDGEWMQGPSIKAMKKMNNQDPSPVMGVETDNEETAKDPDASLLKKTENMIVVRQDKVPWHKMPDGTMMPGQSHKEAMHMMPNGKWMKGASHKEAVMKKHLEYIATPVVDVETGKLQTHKSSSASHLKQHKDMLIEEDDAVPWHRMPDGSMMPGISHKAAMHMMPDGTWMKGATMK